MHTIHIDASPRQLARLRKGHPVRVKPATEGMGVSVMVEPERSHQIGLAFRKGKGVQLKLSADEIAHNKTSGSGLFEVLANKVADKAIDKGLDYLEKRFGGGVRPAPKKGRGRKPKAPKGEGFDDATIRPIMKQVGSFLSPKTVVELFSGGGLAGQGLEDANPIYWGYKLGHDVIGPALYKAGVGRGLSDIPTNIGGSRALIPPTLGGQEQYGAIMQRLGDTVGKEYGVLTNASLGNAQALADQAETMGQEVKKKLGMGMHHREGGSVGRLGGFVGATHRVPQALQSQPFAANFHFQNQMPVAYQKYSQGQGIMGDILGGVKKHLAPIAKDIYKEMEPELKSMAKDFARSQIKKHTGSGLYA